MPFEITVTVPVPGIAGAGFGGGGPPTITKHAVPELDGARRFTADRIGACNWAREGCRPKDWRGSFTPSERALADDVIGEDGGEIRLPDGTLIAVVWVSWNWIIAMADDLGVDSDAVYDDHGDVGILDAFNVARGYHKPAWL